ncbi:hypothetical protein [Pandoravirus japonicus]|uniref:Transmembrane protein n=1 Tax=Pandoravirus japonicus TaxID=2823154 RepID=A0A811BLU0_9VIRU|nr:hypothetical protein [Pandoravirus japonicus]
MTCARRPRATADCLSSTRRTCGTSSEPSSARSCPSSPFFVFFCILFFSFFCRSACRLLFRVAAAPADFVVCRLVKYGREKKTERNKLPPLFLHGAGAGALIADPSPVEKGGARGRAPRMLFVFWRHRKKGRQPKKQADNIAASSKSAPPQEWRPRSPARSGRKEGISDKAAKCRRSIESLY